MNTTPAIRAVLAEAQTAIEHAKRTKSARVCLLELAHAAAIISLVQSTQARRLDASAKHNGSKTQ
jgi:hypothetical protein